MNFFILFFLIAFYKIQENFHWHERYPQISGGFFFGGDGNLFAQQVILNCLERRQLPVQQVLSAAAHWVVSHSDLFVLIYYQLHHWTHEQQDLK